jgi:hypothetical protein
MSLLSESTYVGCILENVFHIPLDSTCQLLYQQFNQAVNRLKESIEKGDYDGEVAHRMTADWLNSELKKRGY